MPVIELTTIIRAPINVCFDLARSIDLHKLSTAGTGEEAIDGVTFGLIGMGEEVTWRARHFGITQSLTSRITSFDYASYFRDEMPLGIFIKIKNTHMFQESCAVTVMNDIFAFQSPRGIIGKVFNRLILTRYLTHQMEKRNQIV